ncbi:MAG: hypothetical protein RDV48_00305 [Candidatus Eremiobacteraeota bacterium]|nr:hypothetical protein [Candidatus Eremiobacteraeota bacterium]
MSGITVNQILVNGSSGSYFNNVGSDYSGLLGYGNNYASANQGPTMMDLIMLAGLFANMGQSSQSGLGSGLGSFGSPMGFGMPMGFSGLDGWGSGMNGLGSSSGLFGNSGFGDYSSLFGNYGFGSNLGFSGLEGWGSSNDYSGQSNGWSGYGDYSNLYGNNGFGSDIGFSNSLDIINNIINIYNGDNYGNDYGSGFGFRPRPFEGFGEDYGVGTEEEDFTASITGDPHFTIDGEIDGEDVSTSFDNQEIGTRTMLEGEGFQLDTTTEQWGGNANTAVTTNATITTGFGRDADKLSFDADGENGVLKINGKEFTMDNGEEYQVNRTSTIKRNDDGSYTVTSKSGDGTVTQTINPQENASGDYLDISIAADDVQTEGWLQDQAA